MGSLIIGPISYWDQIYPDCQVPNYSFAHTVKLGYNELGYNELPVITNR